MIFPIEYVYIGKEVSSNHFAYEQKLQLFLIWRAFGEAIGTYALNLFSVINDKNYSMKAVEVNMRAWCC